MVRPAASGLRQPGAQARGSSRPSQARASSLQVLVRLRQVPSGPGQATPTGFQSSLVTAGPGTREAWPELLELAQPSWNRSWASLNVSPEGGSLLLEVALVPSAVISTIIIQPSFPRGHTWLQNGHLQAPGQRRHTGHRRRCPQSSRRLSSKYYRHFLFFLFFFIYKILFIHERQREREAETQAEGEAGSVVGLEPRTPGS